MSLPSFRLRRLGVAGLACVAALGASAPAHGAQRSLSAQCTFPAIGVQPVKLDLAVSDTAKVGVAASVLSVTEVTLPEAIDLIPALSETSGTLEANLIQAAEAGALATKVFFETPLTTPAVAPAVTPTGAGGAPLVFTSLSLHLTSRDQDGNVLVPPPIEFGGKSDGNPDTADIPCSLSVGGTPPIVLVSGAEPMAPSKPGPLTFQQIGQNSFKVSWTPSVDDGAITGYVVSVSGRDDITVPGTETSATISGLASDTSYVVSVKAVDDEGNRSTPSTGTFRTMHVDYKLSPPTELAVSNRTTSSLTLTWKHSGLPVPATSFVILRDGTQVQTASGSARTATIGGLASGRSYTFAIIAQGAGFPSTAEEATIEASTLPDPAGAYDYTLAGSASLKTLVRGTVPLKGTLGVDLDGGQGNGLALDPTTARLTAAGFLPVTAKLAFALSGAPTVTQVGENGLSVAAKTRVKVTEIKLFGLLLGGGSNCQTRDLTQLKVTSDSAFTLAGGGRLVGTFAMSNLTGCGALNGLVSSLTAGSGNAIALVATPAAPQAN